MASNLTLKRNCRHYDEIFITGCTGSCQNDNYRCSQWWKFSQNDDISVSVLGRLSCTSHGGQRNNHQHCFLVQIVTGKLLVFVSVYTRNMLITYLLYRIYIWFVIYLTMIGTWRICWCTSMFRHWRVHSQICVWDPLPFVTPDPEPMRLISIPFNLPWIFPGVPGNIQGYLTGRNLLPGIDRYESPSRIDFAI